MSSNIPTSRLRPRPTDRRSQSLTSLPQGLAKIIQAALRASDPCALLLKNISRDRNVLKAGRLRYNLSDYHHIYVIGAGKASGSMALALERLLGDRITDGRVVVKYGYTVKVSKIKLMEAGHPIPDRAGMESAREILSLLAKARENDLVIYLLSGGGSALMPLPVKGLTLGQKQLTTQLLLKSGANIQEMNVVRKHLSRIKGGQLARLAAPAHVLTLILSDVPGNPLDTIASGPTVPDSSTYEQAVDILSKYNLWRKLPAAVQKHLSLGKRRIHPETPKPGDSIFDNVQNLIIGDNRVPLRAAEKAARSAGFQVQTLTSFLKGEAREVALVFGAMAREFHEGRRRSRRKRCLLASGETTVTVQGSGVGGRCQEFALAAAMEISGLPPTVVAAFGTDGTDGPTEAAGAYADQNTIQGAVATGLDPLEALSENNSYSFFEDLGQLIITGPTRTNVNDLYLVMTY